MFKPWSFHHHYQQAASAQHNPYVYMRHWHRRGGPSRIVWFVIGATTACAFIAHKEAHEGRKSMYWSHCFKAPIQVPHGLPTSPNQTYGPPPTREEAKERWVQWNLMSEQQRWEESESVVQAKKAQRAQDTMADLSESTLDALIAAIESLKAKQADQKLREDEEERKKQQHPHRRI